MRVPSKSLKIAKQVAQELIAEMQSRGVTEHEMLVVLAVELFSERVGNRDPAYLLARDEILQRMQSPHVTAYTLELLESVANADQRKRHGVYFTPGPVVEWMVKRISQYLPPGPVRIVDPACGGGVFLIDAAQSLVKHASTELIGLDISSAAIAATYKLVPQATCLCVNPLLAGEELAPRLLSNNLPLIVLGNPPYSNYGRANRGPWINALLADYRGGIPEKKLNLTDDYIKFIRWAQYWIKQAGSGILAFITNRTFLNGVTYHGMRGSLRETFNQIEIIDLHGDGEGSDENIFGIRRGVCIAIFVKQPSSRKSIVYVSLRGSRDEKLKRLQNNDIVLDTISTLDCFVPPASIATPLQSDYRHWPRLDEIFDQYISGVQTKNDALFVDKDPEVLSARIAAALSGKLQVAWPKRLSELPNFDPACIECYLVAPGDQRWIYYEPRLLGRARYEVMRHLLPNNHAQNLGLVFMRQAAGTGEYDHALVVDSLVSDRMFYSRRGAPFLAPLCVENNARMNFRTQWLEAMTQRLGYLPTAEQLLAYIYSILCTPQYRTLFAAELAVDFPRIVWPKSVTMFEQFANLGQRLIALHLSPANSSSVTLHGNGCIERGYPRLQAEKLYINRNAWLDGISPAVYAFRVGGYAVMEHWLKCRRGCYLHESDLLSLAQLNHLAVETGKIVASLHASWQELDLT